jgi:hypothetical protein
MSENNKNRICPACHAEQPSSLAIFCSNCGTKLESASPVSVGFSIPIPTDRETADGVDTSVKTEEKTEEYGGASKATDETAESMSIIEDEQSQLPTVPTESGETALVEEGVMPTADMPASTVPESTLAKAEPAADEKLMAFGAALGIGTKEENDVNDAAIAKLEKKISETEKKTVTFTPEISQVRSKTKKSTLAKSFTLFLCSVLLLILAFCPFAHTAVRINEKREVNLDFDMAYAARVTALTFLSYSEEELEKADLYKQYKRSISKVKTEKLNRYDDEKLENYFKMKMELQAISDDSPVRLSMVVTVVFGVIYTLICVVFFLKSASLIIKELSNKSEEKIKRATCGATSALWLITALLPLAYFVWKKFTYFGIAEMSAFSHGSGTSYGFVLSAAVAVTGTVLTVIFNRQGIKNKTTGRLSKKALKSLVLSGIAMLITASVFLPSMGIKFAYDGSSGVKTAMVYATSNSVGEFSSADIDVIADMGKDESYEALFTVCEEATSRAGTEATAFDVFNVLTVGHGRIDASFLYLFIIAVSVLMLLVLALLIRNITLRAFFGARKKTGFLKLLLVLLSVANLVIYIALCVLGKTSAYGELEYIIKVSVGAGPILIFILSVLLVSLFHTHEEKTIDKGYDNPDVSYAPFVMEHLSDS